MVRLRAERDEALAQQAATAEILEIINRSSGDPAPVFDAILERAMRLCDAAFGGLLVPDGEFIKYLTFRNVPERFTNFLTHNRVRARTMFGPNWASRATFNIADLSQSEGYRRRIPITVSAVEDGGIRTMLLVAMMREGAFVGAFTVYRPEVRPFTDRQIAIAQTFAAQAVIAMENARLLTELRESLDRQTAMYEVLRVISASPGQVQPVFEKMLECALRLSRAHMGTISRVVDGIFTEAARIGAPSEFSFKLDNYNPPPDTPLGRMLAAKSTIRIDDYRATEGYAQRNPAIVSLVEQGRSRSAMQVPLLKDDVVVGAMTIYRPEVRPFGDQEATLAEDFAKQAVIAIENARLLTELRERTTDLQQSLEYQTATSDVLKVISRSTFDLTPVLQYVLDTAMRLCHAVQGSIFRLDGTEYRWAVGQGLDPVYEEIERTTHIVPGEGTLVGRAALRRQTVQIVDAWEDPLYAAKDDARITIARTMLGVPLLREGVPIGVIAMARKEVEVFDDKEIDLVTTFADQAVIAIENARLLTELRESLEQQKAIAEVLQVINASPGNLAPVYDVILEKAHTLCGTTRGSLQLLDGEEAQIVAARGHISVAVGQRLPAAFPPFRRLAAGESFVEIPDMRELDDPIGRGSAAHGTRTLGLVPLRKEDTLLGIIVAAREEVRPFTDKQIALLQSFAAHAVIAMDNARLLTELRESLEQQQAIAELLQVINTSPGNLEPVFDAILEKAHALCAASRGALFLADGDEFRAAATRGYPDDLDLRLRAGVTLADARGLGSLLDGARMIHHPDLLETLREDDHVGRVVVERGGVRTNLRLPLRKDGKLLGFISCNRAEVRPFAEKEIALLESFAAQAVIAMENARLLNEIRQRQAELRVTFDNMGDAVIMFDGDHRLVAWNRNFLNMLDIPEEWPATPRSYGDFAAYLTERGEFGDTPPPDLGAPDRGEVRPIRYERARPNGRVVEVRRNPIPGGASFVFIYSDITERKLAEQSILAAREAAERALGDLKLAQANLIQAEKMASLGQLTAGIAHEIKNPLNFVNNFANLSNELLGELKETAAPAFATLDADKRDEIDETMAMLTGNLEKIQEHGKRADGIVKSMLAHSRGGSGDRREADVNALVEESLNLAYHGARAQDQNFNVTLERDYDKTMKPIELVPQDVTRVFLNLCGNGFYAANKRRKEGGDADFRPVLKIATRELGDAVEVRIRDNGTGIPPEIKAKLFQPFFTTKPTGEGTGLGLSISYDIVTQQHGGTIAVDSAVGDFTEFTIHLPRKR